MKRILFIANTPYQILLSSWIKYHYFKDDYADVIVHDRLKGYESVKKGIESLDLFNSVIVMPNQYKKTKLGKVKRILTEYHFARKTFKKANYDEMFFANFGFSSQRIFDFLKRNNPVLKLNYYEDGVLSYSKKLEYFYRMCGKPSLKSFSHNNLLCKNYIYASVDNYCLFDPDLLEWQPEVKKIVALDKIDRNESDFVSIINTIFDFETLSDKYDRKYIFMEESFFQDTGFNEDVELIETLSEYVGKENLMIKIHPRNQVNRFALKGYKTNENTVIPWEVLALNIDLDKKVLISIGSASLVNPVRMFNSKVKTYSIANCLKNKPYLLTGEYGNTIDRVFEYYGVKKVTNINEIE